MRKFLIGSSVLGLTNIKDTDYLYIYDDNETQVKIDDGQDNRYRTKQYQIDMLEFKNDDGRKLFNYQCDKTINKEFGEFIPYNILDYRNELTRFLKEIVKKKTFNFNKRITQGDKCCCKMIYHIAYNLFILENNSPIITDEQKEIIQKIHDKLMPIEYIDELGRRINHLSYV